MTLLSAILLVLFLFGLYLAHKVRSIDNKSRLYKVATFAILATSALAFWEYEISKNVDQELIFLYAKIHTVISMIALHACIISSWALMNKSMNKRDSTFDRFLLAVYSIPAVAVVFGVIFIEVRIFENITLTDGIWVYQLRTDLDWLMICFFLFSFFSLLGVNLSVWRACKKGKTIQNKLVGNIVVFIMVIVSSSVVYFFIFNGEIQQRGFYLLSPLIMLGFIGLAWTSSDFRLFNITPVSAMDNIMDSVSNLVMISDNDFNMSYLNRVSREEFGIGDMDASEISIERLIKVADFENSEVAIEQVKRLKANEKFQTDFSVNLNGSESFYDHTISPIFDNYNRKKGYISISTNVTKLKDAELKLRKNNLELESSNIELERFAYIASHDLKTPLRNVVSFLSLVKRRVKKYDDKELDEFILIANNSASQMHRLIQDVLEYSQVNNYDKKYFKVVDLNEVFSKIKQNLQVTLKEKDGNIICAQLPVVLGDDIRLSQLFQNLIENGLKYNKSEVPTIDISYEKDGELLVFYIKDNGIGVKEDYQKQIFEMFKRLHTSSEYEGTGIGLSTCKKIVTSYGGTIELKSEEGKGSTFRVSLKLVEV